MKKHYLLSILMLVMMAAMWLPQSVNAQVSVWDGTYAPWTNGTGTEADPFLIENAQQLAYLTYRVNNGLDAIDNHVSNHNLYYKLMIDVDLNGSEDFQWTPIGYGISYTNHYSFGGHFDGNNHTVSGLYINSSADCVGFFGYTDGAEIENLSVNGDTVATTGQCAGGIVGRTNETIFLNCFNASNVSSSKRVLSKYFNASLYAAYIAAFICFIKNRKSLLNSISHSFLYSLVNVYESFYIPPYTS